MKILYSPFPVEYDMEIQARLLAALSAIHNFTRDHDSEISEYNGSNIDYEIYHQGGGGYLEAEGLGGDDPEGAAKKRYNCRAHVEGLPGIHSK